MPEGSALPARRGLPYRGAYEATEDGDLVFGGDARYRREDLVPRAL